MGEPTSFALLLLLTSYCFPIRRQKAYLYYSYCIVHMLSRKSISYIHQELLLTLTLTPGLPSKINRIYDESLVGAYIGYLWSLLLHGDSVFARDLLFSVGNMIFPSKKNEALSLIRYKKTNINNGEGRELRRTRKLDANYISSTYTRI